MVGGDKKILADVTWASANRPAAFLSAVIVEPVHRTCLGLCTVIPGP